MENGKLTPTHNHTTTDNVDNVNTVDTGTVGSAKYTVPKDYFRNIDLDQFPQPAEGFVVRAELKKTPDKGIGVFACEFIPANASVHDCNNTLYFTEEETRTILNSLPSDRERKYWLEHGYGEKGLAAYDLDDTIMINHSFDPNIYSTNEGRNYYAARDIKKGEELTEDYRIYEVVPFLEEICEEYGVHDDFLDD